jgi:hypothetical protein
MVMSHAEECIPNGFKLAPWLGVRTFGGQCEGMRRIFYCFCTDHCCSHEASINRYRVWKNWNCSKVLLWWRRILLDPSFRVQVGDHSNVSKIALMAAQSVRRWQLSLASSGLLFISPPRRMKDYATKLSIHLLSIRSGLTTVGSKRW